MTAIQLNPPFKLGRNRPPRCDRKRLLRFANYVDPYRLPAIPPSVDWAKAVRTWGMLGNDVAGDCTAAAFLHMAQAWCAAVGITFTPTTAQAFALYSAVTGYNPVTGANDNGANEIDVLNYCRTTGAAGHKILAYAALNVQDEKEVKQAINLFGGIYIGVSMPNAWQGSKVWRANPNQGLLARLFKKFGGDWTPGSWGGHAIPILGYDDSAENFTVVSWGDAGYRMTYKAFTEYVDEAYAIITTDFINAQTKRDPQGFDIAALQADLQQVTA